MLQERFTLLLHLQGQFVLFQEGKNSRQSHSMVTQELLSLYSLELLLG